MHLSSKATRICVMMALDSVFLVIELGVGYYVSSLALIADAFHMLNDIISLAVGLWAVNLASKESNDRYSYGWLRAEILGAFFNSTFLIGLCVTIVLEALQRFFDPPEIRSPEIILVVGFLGLVSNLVGFWVLGGHGHSHGGAEELEGGHDHDHGHAHDHGHDHDHDHTHDEHAVEDDLDDGELCHDEEEGLVPPQATSGDAAAADHGGADGRHISFSALDGYRGELRPENIERSGSRSSLHSKTTPRGRANSTRRIPTSIDDISIHPASFRQDLREIIAASRSRNIEDEESGDSDDATVAAATTAPAASAGASETTPLISKALGDGKSGNSNGKETSAVAFKASDHAHDHAHSSNHTHAHRHARRDSHGGHHHNAPKDPSKAGAHGHNHGDMGMNAMILHVMGDALGNIGVILTAIIIWKTNWSLRFYADPVVSLFITVIILHSAIPLTKATSKILLQATPDHIDINDIREDIQDLDGVMSCHHVHVWQLSDTQIVASMHIEVSFPISEYGGERYMSLAKRVRKCLHGYGIHSATIQPEFRLSAGSTGQFATGSDDGHDGHPHHPANSASSTALSSSSTAAAPGGGVAAGPAGSTTGHSDEPAFCLLDCVDNCVGEGCCSKVSRNGSRTGSPPGSDHGHSH